MTTLFESARDFQFFDAWEQEQAQTRASTMRARLKQYLELAQTLDYYRERLVDVDIDAASPLQSVPYLTGDELKKLVPPESREILAAKDNNYCIYQTGGTTGFPKTAVFSHREMQALDLANGRGYYACGLEPSDRIGNVFAAGSLYMTFTHINAMLQRYGCINIGFGHTVDPDFFASCMQKFEINALAGVGSTIFNLMRTAKQRGIDLTVEKIFYGGEHIYDADKEMLAKEFGCRSVLSPGYGTVDTWYIGYQCQRAPSGVHHAYDDQCYIEIVNEETGLPCGPGEIGMVYATPFLREATPVVRFRVGDRAYWIEEPCECGRTTPLFHLLGRGDDSFRVGFDTIDYDQMQLVLKPFSGRIGHFQIERKRVDSKDKLLVRVESEQGGEELREEIIQRILEDRSVLKKNIAEGTALPIEVEFVKLNEIALNPRTGKLIKVIDID